MGVSPCTTSSPITLCCFFHFCRYIAFVGFIEFLGFVGFVEFRFSLAFPKRGGCRRTEVELCSLLELSICSLPSSSSLCISLTPQLCLVMLYTLTYSYPESSETRKVFLLSFFSPPLSFLFLYSLPSSSSLSPFPLPVSK